MHNYAALGGMKWLLGTSRKIHLRNPTTPTITTITTTTTIIITTTTTTTTTTTSTKMQMNLFLLTY